MRVDRATLALVPFATGLLAAVLFGLPKATSAFLVAMLLTLLGAGVKRRVGRALLAVVPVFVACAGLGATGLLGLLSPWTVPVCGVIFGGALWTLAVGSGLLRGALALLFALMFSTQWLIYSAISLQGAKHLEFSPVSSPFTKTFAGPARRYRFALSPDGSTMLQGFPHEQYTAVHQLADLTAPPQLLHGPPGSGVARFATTPDRAIVFAADWHLGLEVFDWKDLSKRRRPTVTHVQEGDAGDYHGVAFDEKRSQVLLATTMGDVFVYAYPSLELVRTIHHITGEQLFYWTEVLGDIAIVPGTDTLLILEWTGRVHSYDLSTDRVIASRWVGPSATNFVFAPNGQDVFVGSPILGLVHRLRIADLALLDSRYVGCGARYMTGAGQGDEILISDYFSGEVSLIDLARHEKIATVVVGPRGEWLSLLPDGKHVLMSHALGISTVDVERMRRERPNERSASRFPFYVKFLSPSALGAEGASLSILPLALALGVLALVRRRARRYAETKRGARDAPRDAGGERG